MPEPVPAPASCQGDACQPLPAQLNDPTPSSSSFAGAGNPKKAKKKAKRRRHHQARKHHGHRKVNDKSKGGAR